MTIKKEVSPVSGDQECVECGYEPELKRTLGSFQVFAISFAFISVAVGIFGTYDNVLQTAGPVVFTTSAGQDSMAPDSAKKLRDNGDGTAQYALDLSR